jgi:alpha/beta superfamily hydrolase
MSFMIPAEAVQLEASLREPKDPPLGAAVVCHPHPVYGGTMDNRIVYRAAKAAVAAGFAALRFNFRGVGQSTGQFDQGIGEKEDVDAVIRWMGNKYPVLPLVLIGYSFGAWVGLQIACLEPRIKAVVGIALPLNLYDFEFLSGNLKPSLYIVGAKDELCSRESLVRLEPRLPATSSLHVIEGADHFFLEHTDVVESLIFDFFHKMPLDQHPS